MARLTNLPMQELKMLTKKGQADVYENISKQQLESIFIIRTYPEICSNT